jgi:hypothetical protein
MSRSNSQFIVSIETECLTAVPSHPESVSRAVTAFLRNWARQAPSLAATSGVFNAYARTYCDCGHIEIAMIECDSPYAAAVVFEQQQILATRTVALLSAEGIDLVLSNNTYSGLLRKGCPVWGTHENYLVDTHPSTFTEQILPFLVTRIYGGAGGIHHPSGDFLASARSICLTRASGGSTTQDRAIHSLARDEHHMGASPQRFRYHLILGDGHRSQFNLALQLGATALAVKAALHDRTLRSQLHEMRGQFSADWVATFRQLHVLRRGGQPLQIHPLVIDTQRLYLDAARRVAAEMAPLPTWVPRLLEHWEQTLAAYERRDWSWLAQRLDAFVKHQFYTAVLEEQNCGWAELPQRPRLFEELALLDQNYHEFSNPHSAFAQLEQAGLLDHRVEARIEPGQEVEPYIPDVATRARPRAHVIRHHRQCPGFEVDWAWIKDKTQQRMLRFDDPFATGWDQWVKLPKSARSFESTLSEQSLLAEVERLHSLGRFEHAMSLLTRLAMLHEIQMAVESDELLRHRTRLGARCGSTHGPSLLRRLYPDAPTTFRGVNDHCYVHRFAGLRPNLAAMTPWIDWGRAVLQGGGPAVADIEQIAVFREHAAVALTRHGRMDEALLLLSPALDAPVRESTSFGVQAQLLATLGETYRRQGHRNAAREVLQEAMNIQIARNDTGNLVCYTWPSLAKCEEDPAEGRRWLERAKTMQERHHDHLALTATLLLEARLAGNDASVEVHKTQVLALQDELPVLCQCPLLARIIEHWDAWIHPAPADRENEDFWGL